MDITLYFISGSLYSQEAIKLLENNRFEFRRIEVIEEGYLTDIDRVLGIRKLPAITTDQGFVYEGIQEIRNYVAQA